MKKILYLVVCLVCSMAALAGNPGFGDRKYTISGMAEYSYNTTWGHHANFDIQGLMPFNPHFEMEARLQFSTANVHSGALQLRPKFEALGVGYRMDYVSVTLGLYSRVIDNWDRSWYNDETFVVEPFNLLYRIEVFCRPQNNPWNLSFMFSNVDDYQMERMYQPLFSVGAYYDVTDHWRLNFWAQCKPTGMFHLDATFYGATFRTGFSYRF